MSRIFFAMLTVLFFGAGLAQAAPTKIGISVPLSGNAATLGRQFVAGAEFAISHLKLDEKINLIFSDDGCDKQLAALASEDLAAAKVEMIGGFLCNEAAFTVADLLKDQEIALVISGARANRLTKDAARYGWNIWQVAERDETPGRRAFEFLSTRWAQEAFAIVDDGTVYGRTLADEFRAHMEDAGLKPAFVDNIRPAQSTHAGLVRRLRKAGATAIFLAAGAQDVATVAKNMGEIGLSATLATSDSVALLEYGEDEVSLPVGTLAIMQPRPEDLDTVKALGKALTAANHEPERYLLSGYAAVELFSQLIQIEGREYAGKKFSTILGDVQFDEVGRNTISSYRLYRWNGEKFEVSDQ